MKRDKLSTTRCIRREHVRDRSVQRDKETPIKMQFRLEGRVEKKRAHIEEPRYLPSPPRNSSCFLCCQRWSSRHLLSHLVHRPSEIRGAESPTGAMLDKSKVLIVARRAVLYYPAEIICNSSVSPSARTCAFYGIMRYSILTIFSLAEEFFELLKSPLKQTYTYCVCTAPTPPSRC